MKNSFRKFQAFLTYLCTALLILAVVVISIVVNKNPNTDTAGFGYAPMFMPTDVEKKRDGEGYIYTFTVPEAMKNYGTMYLTFYIKHAYSKVSITGVDDGPWEYSLTDGFHIGKTPGNYWQSVPIIPDFSRKKVIVELRPVYGNLTVEPQFMIVERFMSMYIRMHDDLPVLIFSSIALIIGIFQAVIALLAPYERKFRERLFYLGALTGTTGLWKLMGIPVLTLIFSSLAQTFYYIGICSYFLIPFLSVRFIVCSKDTCDKRINIMLSYLTALSAGLFLLLQLFGIFELHYALPFMAALNILAPLTASISFRFKLKDLWGYLIALAAIADSVIYFAKNGAEDSSFLLAVMLIEVLLGGVLYIWDGVKKEKELKRASNQALVNQIKPHFIFNTMSSIYYMAAEDPGSVMPAIDHFSEYLQANFRAFAEELPIPFEEEAEHTKAYIEVEKLLHKDSLKVSWDITFRDFTLPALSLQPLVENAIKHGMKENEALTVTIGTASEGKDVLVFVEDDGAGIGEKETDLMKGEGALKNIAERIRLLSDGSLSVKERKEGGTRAQITIPLKAAQIPS